VREVSEVNKYGGACREKPRTDPGISEASLTAVWNASILWLRNMSGKGVAVVAVSGPP
jgi:hypothetical protein